MAHIDGVSMLVCLSVSPRFVALTHPATTGRKIQGQESNPCSLEEVRVEDGGGLRLGAREGHTVGAGGEPVGHPTENMESPQIVCVCVCWGGVHLPALTLE